MDIAALVVSTVADGDVDHAAGVGLEVVGRSGSLVGVDVAGNDDVHGVGVQDGLVNESHQLGLLVVDQVGVVPGGVQEDDEPGSDGAVDLVAEVVNRPVVLDGAGLESRVAAERDDVHLAHDLAEVARVGGSGGLVRLRPAGEVGKPVLSVEELVVASGNENGHGCGERLHHVTKGVPDLTEAIGVRKVTSKQNDIGIK